MSATDSAAAIIWNTIAKELSDLPDLEQATRVVFKLVLAALLGGLLGFEREASGKSAGLRTHMLVAMGAAADAHFARDELPAFGALRRGRAGGEHRGHHVRS